MFIIFYIYTILLGLFLLSFFPKDLPFLIKISLVYILGTMAITAIFFLSYPLWQINPNFQYLPFVLIIPLLLSLRVPEGHEAIPIRLPRRFAPRNDIIVLVSSLIFSSFLFLKTVWYDFSTGQTLIMGKLWSDFGAHVSLIRSFSQGFNFPPEYPLFAHAPIKYYFFFHFHVALWEKFGLPLFAAINLPSILGFICVLLLIYSFGAYIFKSKLTGVLAVIFFLFNASLSWWYFIKNHSLFDLFKIKEFPAFNPYDGSLVSGGFWNLNVYTNQRHLPLSLALLLLLIFLFLWKRQQKDDPGQIGMTMNAYLILGLVLGLSPLFHGVIFLMILLSLPFLFLTDSQKKKFIIMTAIFGIIALPSLLYLRSGGGAGIKFLPGYLTAYNLTFFTFTRYWLLNLGLLVLLTPLGFFICPKNIRYLFLFAIPPFLIGNLFSFSTDVATNHKFFNFAIIIFNLYTAYFIAKLFHLSGGTIIKHLTGVFFSVVLIFFLTVSGFIDIFPIVNDTYFGVPDPSHKKDIEWIGKNTDKKAVLANSYYLYHPASLSGRRIPLGWPYFAWSAGYDTETRVRDLTNLYLSKTKTEACSYVKKLNTDYVTLNLNIRDVNIKFDENFWKTNFPTVYENASSSGLLIFEVKKNCGSH